MSKTIVAAKHLHGPLENGYGGCSARAGNGGMCPGVAQAAWLNGLGDDDAFYIKPTRVHPDGTTNLQVRLNWLNHYDHLVVAEAEMAELLLRRVRAKRELSALSRRIKALRDAKKDAPNPNVVLGDGPISLLRGDTGYRR